MKITRRQFGITALGAVVAFLLSRFLGRMGPRPPTIRARSPRARFWKRADHLAG